MHRRVVRGEHVLDHRHLLRTRGLVFHGLQGVRIVRHFLQVFGALVARDIIVQTVVVRAQALDVVVRGFEHRVRDEHDGHAVAGFELGNFRTLFVQEVGRDVHRHLRVQRARAFLRCFLLQDAQHLQGAAFRVADDAHAVAARAGDVVAFGQGGAQALARELHQAKTADAADLDAGSVRADGVPEALLDFALVAGLFHVDEVDHDEAAQVAKAHLARDFLSGFNVGLHRRFFNVGAAGGAGGVDVHGDKGLRVVDHNGAARGKRHRARVGGLDLVLNLKAREKRRLFAIALHAAHHVGHDVRHELAGLLVDVVRVDENFADVGLEVVADRANDEVALFDDEKGRRVRAL